MIKFIPILLALENKSQDLISVMLNAQSFKSKVKKFSKAATAKTAGDASAEVGKRSKAAVKTKVRATML